MFGIGKKKPIRLEHELGWYWYLNDEPSGELTVVKLECTNTADASTYQIVFVEQPGHPKCEYEKYKHRILEEIDYHGK